MIQCSISDNHKMIGVTALFLYQLIELWLGKTNRVKAGSALELIFNILKTGATFIWRFIWKKPMT